MKSSVAIIEIRERLNKRDSQLGKNIKKEAIQGTVNKAVLDLCRRTLKGKNSTQEQAEETDTRVGDLQVLIRTNSLSFKNKELYVETERIPTDFFKSISLQVLAKKDDCREYISSNPREEVNVIDLLKDWSSQPSFDFDQSFHTFVNNKIKQYHNKDFDIEKIELTYYKLPKYIRFPNTYQPDGKPSSDDIWEFKEDFCGIIIDEAVKVIAGDIESINQHQLAEKRVEENI